MNDPIDKIEELKTALEQNDPRGKNRKTATTDQKRIWYKSYDELEELMDEEDFDEFIDSL